MLNELLGLPTGRLMRNFDHDFMNMPSVLRAKTDIVENETNYEISMELPGFNKEEISVNAIKNGIVITAKKDETKEEKDDKKYLMRERTTSSISRSFTLENPDPSGIKADFKDGILTITIEKPDEKEPEKTEIKID